MIKIYFWILVLLNSINAFSQDDSLSVFKEKTEHSVKEKLEADLTQYCHNMCKIIKVEAVVKESFLTRLDSLGFEREDQDSKRVFQVEKAHVEILVDDRFGSSNIEKLKTIIGSLTKKMNYPLETRWAISEFPESPSQLKSIEEIKNQFSSNIYSFLLKNIQEYCPGQCKILQYEPVTQKIKAENIGSYSQYSHSLTQDGNYGIVLVGAKISLALNSNMDDSEKERLKNLFISETSKFGTTTFDFQEFPFPKTKLEQERESQDPYGLERLTALLRTLRENATTKEIYKEKETTQSSSKLNEKSTNSIDKSVSEKDGFRDSSISNKTGIDNNSYIIWSLAALLFLLLILFVFSYFNRQNQIIKSAIDEAKKSTDLASPFLYSDNNTHGKDNQDKKLMWRIYNLKLELLKHISANPIQAKSAFLKILSEPGPLETAKIVSILDDENVYSVFKKMDPSEQIQSMTQHILSMPSTLAFEEQHALLKLFQNHLTATLISPHNTPTSSTDLDFLKHKSPKEIYALINDEPPSLQGLVLTQLNPEVRASIFRITPAEKQPDILSHLSKWEALPKKSLQDVSAYLLEKSKKIPFFDTESISGKDIIKDLAERLSEEEQLQIIKQCDLQHPETATYIRRHLITTRTIEFLPTSLIIDILLSLDPALIAPYLSVLKERTRETLLLRLPKELRESWKEAIQTFYANSYGQSDTISRAKAAVEEKLRQLAKQNAFDLYAINSRLFPIDTGASSEIGSELKYQKAS